MGNAPSPFQMHRVAFFQTSKTIFKRVLQNQDQIDYYDEIYDNIDDYDIKSDHKPNT